MLYALIFFAIISDTVYIAKINEQSKKIKCLCTKCSNPFCNTTNFCVSAAIKINSSYFDIERYCVQGLGFVIPSANYCDHSDVKGEMFIRCCFTENCNNLTLDYILPLNYSHEINKQNIYLQKPNLKLLYWGLFVLFIGLSLAIIVLLIPIKTYESFKPKFIFHPILMFRRKLYQSFHSRNSSIKQDNSKLLRHQTNNSEETQGIGNRWLNSSSIANQIDIKELIGAGRYGQVFRGTWNCQNIAVKIMSPSTSENGLYEAYIYQNFNLRNENIVCFIALDRIFKNEWLQTWLAFDYHPHGSLYTFLCTNKICIKDIILALKSIAAGISYLHLEIVGSESFKPQMAHRDIKTSNILVKNDGTCVISDLGTVIVDMSQYHHYIESNNLSNFALNSFINYENSTQGKTIEAQTENQHTVGTRRYLPPESLALTFSPLPFENIQKGDVYAFGLVCWEVLNSFSSKEEVIPSSYEFAYQQQVKDDRDLHILHETIVVKNIRPTIPIKWRTHPILNSFVNIMQECWYTEPESRPKIINIRRRIDTISNLYSNIV